MINYSDLHYYSKPITELSKEELIKVIVYILQKHEECNEELYKIIELLEKNWFKLPLKLRQKYWKETDYGRLKPSKETEEEMKLILGCNDVKF